MKIYAKSKRGNVDKNKLPLTAKVKELGDYLFKNLGDAKVPSRQPINGYEIYTNVYYMIKPDVRKAMKEYPKELKGIEDEVYTVKLLMSIATYRQYIRILIIKMPTEDDPRKPTIGWLRLEPEELLSLSYCQKRIVDYSIKAVEKYYSKYEVLL